MDPIHEDAEAEAAAEDPTGEAREEATIGTRGKTAKRAIAEAVIATEVVEATDAAPSASEAVAAAAVVVAGTRSAEVNIRAVEIVEIVAIVAIVKVTDPVAETRTSINSHSFRPTTTDSTDFATEAWLVAAAAQAPVTRSPSLERVLTGLDLQSGLLLLMSDPLRVAMLEKIGPEKPLLPPTQR